MKQKAGSSEFEKVTTLKVFCQLWLPASSKTIWIKLKEKTWRNFIFQMLKGSLHRSQWWDLTEIQTDQSWLTSQSVYDVHLFSLSAQARHILDRPRSAMTHHRRKMDIIGVNTRYALLKTLRLK